jgi:hypothetical protein
MPSFEIIGKGKDTGRTRKRIYSAASESKARELAEKDGTLVEQVVELPPEPPTESQLAYARDLGLPIPQNATKADVSDLISVKVDRDKPSTPRHRAFAELFGLEATPYVGKRALFNRIQATLCEPGREKELLSWFTYRVYRELTGAKDDLPVQGPNDPLIIKIAESFVRNEQVINSIRRYKGGELIWFGEWTTPDGYVHQGGSNRTAAYKEVSSSVKQVFSLPERSPRKVLASANSAMAPKNPRQTPSGCLPVIALMLLIPAVLLSFMV